MEQNKLQEARYIPSASPGPPRLLVFSPTPPGNPLHFFERTYAPVYF